MQCPEMATTGTLLFTFLDDRSKGKENSAQLRVYELDFDPSAWEPGALFPSSAYINSYLTTTVLVI